MVSHKRYSIIKLIGLTVLFIIAISHKSYAWSVTTKYPSDYVGYYMKYATDNYDDKFIPYGYGIKFTSSDIETYNFYVNGTLLTFSKPDRSNFVVGFNVGDTIRITSYYKKTGKLHRDITGTVRNYRKYSLYGASRQYYFDKYTSGHSAWEYGTQHINYGDAVRISFCQIQHPGTGASWGLCFGDNLSQYISLYHSEVDSYTFIYDGSQTGWWRVYKFNWYSSAYSDLIKLTDKEWRYRGCWEWAIDWPKRGDTQDGIGGPFGGFYIAPNNVTVTYDTVDWDTGKLLASTTANASPGSTVKGSDIGTGGGSYNGLWYVYYYSTSATANQGTHVIRYMRKQTYKVIYQPNGGDGYASTQTYLYDKQYTTPHPGNKTGYTFKGWSKSPYGGAQYGTSVNNVLVRSQSENITTLYAIWSANKYTVSFLNTRDSNISSRQVTYMSTYGNLPSPTATGWRFVEWRLSSNVIRSSTTVTTPRDHQLTAVWEEIKHTVTYVSPSKTQVVSVLDHGKAFPPYTPKEIGMVFKHWSMDANGNEFNFDTDIVRDTTLYAVFEPKVITIKLPGTNSITRKYNSSIGELPIPERVGFEFDGWYYDTSLTQKVNSSDKVKSEDYTLVPSYKKKSFTVVCNPIGNKISVHYGDPIPDLPKPSEEGKVFKRWVTEDSLTVKSGDRYAWNHDIILQAKFEDIKYSVLLPDGSVREKTYNDMIGTLPIPEDTGYQEFAGYVDQFGASVSKDTKVLRNMSVSYVFRDKYVSVTLIDGDSRETVSVKAGTKLTDLPIKYRSGYTFQGWSLTSGGAVSSVSINSNITVYAVYGTDKQRVVFEGTDVVLELLVGQPIGVMPTVKRDNQYLVGWKDTKGNRVSRDTKVPLGGLILSPVFAPRGSSTDTVEIRYWSDDVKINTIDLIEGDPLWDPGDPPLKQISSRTFLYWSDRPNGTKYIFGNYVSDDLDLYAVWK